MLVRENIMEEVSTKELERRLNQLKGELGRRKRAERTAAKREIRKIAANVGETVESLFSIEKTGPPRLKKRGARRGKLPPKFCNPADRSQTWSGRGRRPQWYKDALAAGKTNKDLLIRR